VDGVIIADLPPAEGDEWVAVARKCDLDTIFLVAPTSTDEAIRAAAQNSSGFIYCISLLGVTGARATLPGEMNELLSRVRSATNTPALVGFGISKPEHVREACGVADGVVVGSALVSLIAGCANDHERLSQAAAFLRILKAATR